MMGHTVVVLWKGRGWKDRGLFTSVSVVEYSYSHSESESEGRGRSRVLGD